MPLPYVFKAKPDEFLFQFRTFDSDLKSQDMLLTNNSVNFFQPLSALLYSNADPLFFIQRPERYNSCVAPLMLRHLLHSTLGSEIFRFMAYQRIRCQDMRAYVKGGSFHDGDGSSMYFIFSDLSKRLESMI